MGVWSGDNLYFRDSGSVKVWHDGAVKTFLPGLAWFQPKASPAGGRLIAYYTNNADGLASISVVDTVSGSVQHLSNPGRVAPVFLSSRYVWYQGERLCAPGDQCVFTKTILTGKTYIYDLQTGTESESLITDLADVWPNGG